MTALSPGWIGSLMVMVMMLPNRVQGQTSISVVDAHQKSVRVDQESSGIQAARQSVIETTRGSVWPFAPQNPSPASEETGMTRSQRVAIGVLVGGGVGAVAGEYLLGQKLDIAHGPDMLLGFGIGACAGALIALSTSQDQPQHRDSSRSVRVVPLLSSSRRALLTNP